MYKKPTPISVNKIKIGEWYYVPGYSGSVKVQVVGFVGNKSATRVKTKNNDNIFVRSAGFIFADSESASYARREWESSERKRKKAHG